jgi:hypothetical protein
VSAVTVPTADQVSPVATAPPVVPAVCCSAMAVSAVQVVRLQAWVVSAVTAAMAVTPGCCRFQV